MIRSVIFISGLLCLAACSPSIRYGSKNPEHESRATNQTSDKLDRFIQEWIGAPYMLGGVGKDGIDCSGFTHLLYESVYRISLPRQAEDQFKQGYTIQESALRPGDLVFFKNIRRTGIDHVGVYVGEKRFVHASTSAGVTISGLDEEYYRKRFVGARRYR